MVTPVSGTTRAQEESGYWELIGIYTNDWETELVAWNNAEECINLETNVSEGSVTATSTYTCEAKPMGLSYHKPGITESQTITWSKPSETNIHPGKPFSIDLTSTITRMDDPEMSYLFNVTAFYGTIDDLNGIFGRYPHHNYMKDENGLNVAVTSELTETSITTVSGTIEAGSFEGEQMVITVSVYGYIPIQTKYVYAWRSQTIGPVIGQEPEIESEPEFEPELPTLPASGGAVGRIIVVVGIAIAGTLSTIAGELANKASQAAASSEEKQPEEEIVYVLNPSHKQFELEVNKPVTLTVNAYRVTKEGHQLENGAEISLNLPPDLAECFSIQTSTSPGQLAANITLLKIPSASAVILDLNGVFPQGKAKTEVKLMFKMDFTISPVHTPNITFNEKEKLWQPPELVACFREPVHKTPLQVGFYYGFMDPPLTFEPDILEVKEGYSSDDGLTYNFKLRMRDGIDLETYFGGDLTDDDGRVKVNVAVKDEKGKEFTAETDLQVSPQLRMIAYSYNRDVKTPEPRLPNEGLELDNMEFVADGIDKLPLVIFFIRSDKQVAKGSEAEAVMDIVDVKKIDWITTESFEEPAVNAANTSNGFFAYDLASRELIAADKTSVNGTYELEVDAWIISGAPKNYSIDGSSLRFKVKPQFILLRMWVVPGYKQNTSEAIAYAKLLPSHKPFTGLKLTLETSGGGGATLNINDNIEKITLIKEPQTSGKVRFEMVKGTARWILTYSGLKWNNLSSAQFQVTCNGPRDSVGNYLTASDSFDVHANVMNMLSDLLTDSSIQSKMNNPYYVKENYAIPEFLNGPIWNCSKWFSTNEPYVCHQMRSDIIEYLQKRRHFNSDRDLKSQLASMRGMNGIEYENYYIYSVHVWAGFFLSGDISSNYRALDPWWEQRWVDPSFKNPENLMTINDEAWNLTKTAASVGIVATAAVSALAAVGVVVSLVAMTTLLQGLLLGMTVTAAAQAAGITNVLFSSAFDYGSVADPNDKTLVGFPKGWLVKFIQRLDQQDIDEWRKS